MEGVKHFINFQNLGIHLDINPIAFQLGAIKVHWYGIIIALSIMISLILAMRDTKKFGIKEDDMIDMFLIALPVSIVFARLFFVVFTWSEFKNDLMGIFRIWNGGLAIYGAIIGAVLSVFIYSRRKKINMLDLCDFACVYLPLSQAIGRWGNFTNQELYGSRTTLPWGMTGSVIGDVPVHPTFLYESLLNIIVFIVLLRIRKNRKIKGSVFASYLMLYSVVRFLMEFIRVDEFGVGEIRYNQVFAALVFIGAIVWFVYLKKRSEKAEVDANEELAPSAYAGVLHEIAEEEKQSDIRAENASEGGFQDEMAETEAAGGTEHINENNNKPDDSPSDVSALDNANDEI